jgi:HemY protein
MRLGFWAVVTLALGTLAAHFLLQDRGYVLINFRGYVVEMSVPALALALVLLYAAVRAALALWRLPRRMGEALAERRTRRAGEHLSQGMIDIVEGRWSRGERLLGKGVRGTGAPLVNYLMAARAAQLQGSDRRRDEWLKLAYEELPEAETTVLLTQAELQLANGELERALATLERIQERQPDHPVGLAMLAQAYRRLGDWERLVAMLPRLGRARLDATVLEELAAEGLARWLERSELTQEQLKRAWGALPARLRGSTRLTALRALALDRLGRGDDAERELRAALKRTWDPALVRAYGQVASSDRLAQLRRVESWLRHHSEDGVLLATAARLCIANELWGKARSYLESSLAVSPDAEAYALYGRLLDRLGEEQNAALAYQAGLGLVAGADLPALEAPEPRQELEGMSESYAVEPYAAEPSASAPPPDAPPDPDERYYTPAPGS